MADSALSRTEAAGRTAAATRTLATARADAVRPMRDRAVLWAVAKGSGGQLVDECRNFSIQHGSSSGGDTNDPKWLPFNGRRYGYFPGVNNQYWTTADAAPLQLSTGLDIRVNLAANDYTPASTQHLVAKYSSSPSLSYRFYLNAAGTLSLTLSGNGTTTATTSSVAPTVNDGQDIWLRVTWRNSDGRTQFFTSSDGSTWSQLGTDQTISTVTVPSIAATSAALMIGASSSGTGPYAGRIYRVQIRSSIDGTIVYDADMSSSSVVSPFETFTETSANTFTVTVNRTTGVKCSIVHRDTYLFGVDDYLEIADSGLLDCTNLESMTAYILVRVYGTTANSVYIAKASSSTTVGWFLHRGSAGLRPTAKTNDPSGHAITFNLPAFVSGSLNGLAIVRTPGAADNVTGYTNAVADTPVTDSSYEDISNSEPLRIGRYSNAGTSYIDMEFYGVAFFKEALTAAELQRVYDEINPF